MSEEQYTCMMPSANSELNLGTANTYSFFFKKQEEVIRIQMDGRIFWNGREVETDDDFRKVVIEILRTMHRYEFN